MPEMSSVSPPSVMKHFVLAAAGLLMACNSQSATSERAPEAKGQPIATTPPAVSAEATASAAPAARELTLVADSSQVCMVNNQFMGREQIPVEVDGKTYFGCCEMCKGRLARDPAARSAKDPLSGKLVDKASAVIAKRPSGEVLYFESTDSLERFRAL